MNGSRLISIFLFFAIVLLCAESQALNWQRIVDKNKNALITLRYYAPYKINNESIGTFFATGTIVDKAKGIVLVDRETSQVSPSVITGYLQNYEEIELTTLYYDPIHNYAFLKYDPQTVKWADIDEVRLGDSDTVRLGDAIVLLSTKKNKNLGVVHGNIVDWSEPRRRNDFKYQDYNITYFDTSLVSISEGGGIILNKKGRAVALHSWVHAPDPFNSEKDKNFYAELPINYISDVLSALKEGNEIMRGDLGLTLDFMPNSEVLKFGVPQKVVGKIQKEEDSKGLLFVTGVVMGTPNFDKFKVGDILVSIEGKYIARDYLKYERILNKQVNRTVKVEIYRKGKRHVIEAEVFNLLNKKISNFLFFSGGIFQDLPWFIKVRTNIGNQGVYVSSYYSGSPLACSNFFENNVILSVNGRPIKNLGDFYDAVKDLQNEQLIKIRYVDLVLNNKEYIRSFRVNTKFYPTRRFKKRTSDGDWVAID